MLCSQLRLPGELLRARAPRWLAVLCSFYCGSGGTGHHLVATLVDKFPGVQSFPRLVQQLFAEMWEPAMNEERRAVKRAELHHLLKNDTADSVATHFVV